MLLNLRLRSLCLVLLLINGPLFSSKALARYIRVDRSAIPEGVSPELRKVIEGLYADSLETCLASIKSLAAFGEDAAVAAPFLVTTLRGKNEAVPLAAHAALVRMGRAAIEPVVWALRVDGHRYTRMHCLQILGAIQDERATRVLIETAVLYGDRQALSALAAQGLYAQEPLEAQLEDPDLERRIVAIKALTAFSTTAMMDRLLQLTGDPQAMIRHEAVNAVLQMHRNANDRLFPSEELLDELLAHPDPQVSEALIPLKQKFPAPREQKIVPPQAVAQIPEQPAQPEALLRWYLEFGGVGAFDEALKLAAGMRDKGQREIERVFKNRNSNGRIASLKLAAALNDQRYLPLLTGALLESEAEIRLAAAQVYSSLKQLPGVIEKLVELAASAKHPEVILALGYTGNSAALQALQSLPSPQAQALKLAFAESYARLNALDAWKPFLQDEAWQVRALAAWFGRLFAEKTQVNAALLKLLQDPHWYVRQLSAASLSSNTGRSLPLDYAAWKNVIETAE